MPHRLMAGALILFLAVRCPGAEPSQVVRDIRIENLGPGPLDEEFVRSQTSLRAGDRLDRVTVSKDIRQLLSTGRFSDVTVEVEPAAEGMRVIYRLKNKLRLAEPVRITGAENLRESKIRDLIGLEVGDVVDDAVLGARTQKVVAEYRKHSYPEARVTWEIAEKDPAAGLGDVTVLVREGGRARVRRVTFTGNTAFSARQLKPALKPPAWWNVFRWFSRRRFDREAVEHAAAEIRAMYLDRGYLDVAVEPPRITQDERGRVSVEFVIREGPAYRLGRLEVTGVSVFPQAEVTRVVRLQSGEVAAQSAMDQAASDLRDFYGSCGYAETRVRPTLTPHPSEGRVDVVFAITEGTLTHIRNILIRGNARTRDKVIRREIRVAPGEILNEVKVRQSERVLSNLGFFSAVRSDTLATDRTDWRDLLFVLEEKPTGQFMVGGGFSSVDQLTAYMELGQGNFDLRGWPYFTGGGQKLKLRGQVGTRRRDVGLSFVEPWFLDRKLSLGVDLDRSDYEYTDYDIERTSAAVTLGKALPGPNRVSLGYRIEAAQTQGLADDRTYVYADAPRDEYVFEDEDSLKSSLRLTLTHDTRDRPFLPRRGRLAYVFGTLSGGPLGADTEIYELGFNAVHYVSPWFSHVLSLRGRMEVVEAYGDTEEVPLSDRLFIGGGRTVRGYDYRDVGPKVVPADDPTARDYRPVGGKSLALAKAEYSVPVVTAIRLATFFDIGNVWRDAYEFDFGHLASSAGVGLRFDIPGFPIAIDRAWPVEPDSDLTDREAWVFWIGFEY